MFRFLRGLPLGLLALAACAPGAGPRGAAPDPGAAAARAEATITAGDVRARIEYLASDELGGRDTPSPGLELAALHVARAFESAGLEPAGDDGGYIQRWPFVTKSFDRAAIALSIEGGAAVPPLEYGRDFFVIPAALDGADAEPVYLGPIDALGEPWPAEAAGRIAVLAAGPRLGGVQVAPLFRQAFNAGAAGVVIVLHPTHDAGLVGMATAQLAGGALESPVPVAGVLRGPVEPALRAAGVDLDAAGPVGATVLPSLRIRLNAPVRREEHAVPNVVAVLPGRDPVLRDEYVVLTAHVDHIGVGRPDASGDSIYNGADDNASGTSAIIEAAEALAALPEPPRRSVLFLVVSGEEQGLLGARYFAENPTVPVERVVANINLDMVGRNAPDTVVAIGQEYTSLGPLAHRVAADEPALGLTIIEDPNPAEQAFFRSDHVAFLRKDIPSLFLTGWLHEDYHRPSDEADRVDAGKVARVARLVFRMTRAIADDPARPAWLGDGLERVRERLRRSPLPET